MEKQILELAKKILAETEVHRVLDKAMDQLIQLSGAERGMVILFDQAGGVLFETARNLKKEDIDNPEFEVSRTIIDKVKTGGEVICLANVFDDPSLQKSVSTKQLKILSVVCLPLLHHGDTFGVIYLDNSLVRGNKALSCIEIKYTASPKLSKGFQIAIEDLQTKDNFIIVPKSETYQLSRNLKVCNLSEFLVHHNSSFLH